jgi:hypothetical protein
MQFGSRGGASVTRRKQKKTARKNHRGRTESGTYSVSLSPAALAKILSIATVSLLACHGALAFYHYQISELPWLLLQLFDVDQENNLPTWFSELLLLISSACLFVCARRKRAVGDAWTGHWYVLCVGFFAMAIDEIAGIHESVNSIIVVSWAIPTGIASLVAGLAFIPFLRHLPRRTALLFAVAGSMFLMGAAGLEIIGNDLVSRSLRKTLQYNLWTMLEEALEMFGVILFTHTLLEYMREPDAERVEISLEIS